ncbi:hypothetical protein C5167_008819 [Papaver somniferum]|uniref:Uncharacterized protein n=1 Tax=Papaver somniferum TaxID=3469 RepID=A0A4Y7JX25_PAPSO|nr:hypothetical protein C5167_008819 [Papaver somniferum]
MGRGLISRLYLKLPKESTTNMPLVFDFGIATVPRRSKQGERNRSSGRAQTEPFGFVKCVGPVQSNDGYPANSYPARKFFSGISGFWPQNTEKINHCGDGEERCNLHPRGALIGDTIVSGTQVPISMGNVLPLSEGGGGGSKGSRKRPKNYTKRFGKMHAKETLLRNASAFAECLFQSWRDDDDSQPSSSEGNSWFKRYWPKEPKKNSTGSQGSRWETYRGRRGSSYWLVVNVLIIQLPFEWEGVFQFCDASDEEVETKFGSAFHRSSQNTRYRFEDDYETYEDFSDSSNSSASDLASDRLALGLSAFGPLKLNDVKNA